MMVKSLMMIYWYVVWRWKIYPQEDISKIFKENFNAFKKVENLRHEKYKSSKVCKKDKQPSYPYTDQQLQHVDHLVDNKFLKDIPASAEYLSGLNREYTNAHKYNEDVRKPYILVKIWHHELG